MNTASRLLNEIVRLGGKPNPPASLSSIAIAEKRLQCSFPEQLKKFYLLANGLSESTTDLMWDFFDLDRLTDLYSHRFGEFEELSLYEGNGVPSKTLICFCDVLIDLPTYAFCGDITADHFGRIYADQNNKGWLVSSSFSEFVDIFISDNDEILLGLK